MYVCCLLRERFSVGCSISSVNVSVVCAATKGGASVGSGPKLHEIFRKLSTGHPLKYISSLKLRLDENACITVGNSKKKYSVDEPRYASSPYMSTCCLPPVERSANVSRRERIKTVKMVALRNQRRQH